METISTSRLNALLASWPAGEPRSADDLRQLGVSADLAVHYVRAGWLERLGRGVYRRPNDPLRLAPAVRLLLRSCEGLHVGGVTALHWHGIRHQVSQRDELRLYGWTSGPLPGWIAAHFPNRYHRLRLFDESPGRPLRVAPFSAEGGVPTSEPERAMLEMLSEVGLRQTLAGARDLAESAISFRHEVMTQLLERCTSVKTVRLCLMLGNELQLPWHSKLPRERLRTGSDTRWVSRGKGGTLVLPP